MLQSAVVVVVDIVDFRTQGYIPFCSFVQSGLLDCQKRAKPPVLSEPHPPMFELCQVIAKLFISTNRPVEFTRNDLAIDIHPVCSYASFCGVVIA